MHPIVILFFAFLQDVLQVFAHYIHKTGTICIQFISENRRKIFGVMHDAMFGAMYFDEALVPVKTMSFAEICQEYTQKIQSDFHPWITSTPPEKSSANIDAVFYNLPEYKKIVSVPKNNLELTWGRRVLLESTPYGIVAMYYDAYKLAFSYFCDQRSVSYSVLNAVAMKYVRRFCCLNLFVDETVWSSPLLDVWKAAEKKEEEEKRGKKKELGLDFLKDAPFVSKKNPKTATTGGADNKSPKEEEKNKNRFVYIGNLQMHFTQTYMKAPPTNVPTVKDPSKIKLSYKDFLQQKKSMSSEERQPEERPDWTLLSKFPEDMEC